MLFRYSIQEIENQTHPNELLYKIASYVRMGDWKEHLKGNNLTTFIIVRHPFYRLVSAFTSIFEIDIETCITKNATDILDLRQMIIRIFRPKAKNYGRKAKNEVLLELLSSKKSYLRSYRDRIISKHSKLSLFPTFWEFVQAILNKMDTLPPKVLKGVGKDLAVHWRPIYQMCTVCHRATLKNLQYILRYESFPDEVTFHLKILTPKPAHVPKA